MKDELGGKIMKEFAALRAKYNQKSKRQKNVTVKGSKS